MKCRNCRAVVDDGLERCTFCGAYFKGSMLDHYKLETYDPTQDMQRQQAYQQQAPPPPSKPKFRLFK